LTAALLSNTGNTHTGLRPIDPRRDMRQVATLIETAFGENLDRAGRRMLRWMRTLGRAGWVGWLLGYWLLPPAARPRGFVWERDGRIVGNASLLPVEGYPGRWVLANVAVHPDFRRQGIARSLVQESLEWMERRTHRTLLLQVSHENKGARKLYTDLRFETLITRTVWVRSSREPAPQVPMFKTVRRREPSEWRRQWDLAKRLHPEGVIWPFPTVASLFRPRGPSLWWGWDNRRHWLWEESGRLLGSLTARQSMDVRLWDVILVVEPEAWGRVEVGLLGRALASPLLHRRLARLEYPADVAVDVLRSLGFEPRRTLTWMAQDFDRSSVVASR
jgi:ribosomal protein S18 acetylase RimI-like enzyme